MVCLLGAGVGSAAAQSGAKEETKKAGEAAKAAHALTEARGLAARLDQASAGKASEAAAILDRAAASLPGATR